MSAAAATRALPLLATAYDALAGTVDGLGPDDLARPSRAAGWSVAQVLSHLGSGAEICTALVRRGLVGDDRGPVRDELVGTWARWDDLTPAAQVASWHDAERTHLELLAGLTPQQLATVRVPYFVGPLTLDEYAGYRLSESVVHAWDVQAALDPSTSLLPAAVPTLLARLDLVVSRFRDGEVLASLQPTQVAVHLTDAPGDPSGRPGVEHVLDVREELHLWPCAGAEPDTSVSVTREALVRLVYGRHPEAIEISGRLTAAQLRSLFPGF